MGAMFLDAEMIMEEVVHIPDEVPSASCISSCVAQGVLLDQQLFLKYIFYGNSCYWATIVLVVFKRLSSRLKFSLPFGHSGFLQEPFSQNICQTCKAFLIKLATETIIDNHFTKITVGKFCGEHRRAVTLTRHIALLSNIGQPSLGGIWYLSYDKFCH